MGSRRTPADIGHGARLSSSSSTKNHLPPLSSVIPDTHRAGYEAGWRDAAFYYGRGYRPDYWGYDPHGGWYFSFSIVG